MTIKDKPLDRKHLYYNPKEFRRDHPAPAPSRQEKPPRVARQNAPAWETSTPSLGFAAGLFWGGVLCFVVIMLVLAISPEMVSKPYQLAVKAVDWVQGLR